MRSKAPEISASINWRNAVSSNHNRWILTAMHRYPKRVAPTTSARASLTQSIIKRNEYWNCPIRNSKPASQNERSTRWSCSLGRSRSGSRTRPKWRHRRSSVSTRIGSPSKWRCSESKPTPNLSTLRIKTHFPCQIRQALGSGRTVVAFEAPYTRRISARIRVYCKATYGFLTASSSSLSSRASAATTLRSSPKPKRSSPTRRSMAMVSQIGTTTTWSLSESSKKKAQSSLIWLPTATSSPNYWPSTSIWKRAKTTWNWGRNSHKSWSGMKLSV